MIGYISNEIYYPIEKDKKVSGMLNRFKRKQWINGCFQLVNFTKYLSMN